MEILMLQKDVVLSLFKILRIILTFHWSQTLIEWLSDELELSKAAIRN